MSFKSKFVMIVLSASLATYAIAGAWLATRAQQPANDPNSQQRILESVLQHIQNDYVDEPNMEKVRAGALRGLAYGLDPYSTYLTPEQVKDYNAGNIIEYIDNKATRDISLYDAKQLLNGPAGSEVKLRVLRANSSPLTITVKRGSSRPPAAEARMEAGRVGILRINSLNDGESNEAKAKLQDLLKQGAQKIVIDLRDTAGGSLNDAVSVANFFIKDGVIAQTVGREGKALKTFNADPKVNLFTGPVVAMIDTGTAGAAEVVASALIERNRGQVVGEKSFGAGTEQQLFTLRGGDGLLLTTVKWASANGKTFLGEDRTGNDTDNINNKPEQGNEKRDVAPTPAKPASEDLQLKKALELLKDKPV